MTETANENTQSISAILNSTYPNTSNREKSLTVKWQEFSQHSAPLKEIELINSMRLDLNNCNVAKLLKNGKSPLKIAEYNLKKKYSSSQTYHYVKDINSILLDERMVSNINWQDLECYIEEVEHFIEVVPLRDYYGHL